MALFETGISSWSDLSMSEHTNDEVRGAGKLLITQADEILSTFFHCVGSGGLSRSLVGLMSD